MYTAEPVSPPADPESSPADPESSESPPTEPGSPPTPTAGRSTAAGPATAPESVPGPSRHDTGSVGGKFTGSSYSDQGVVSDSELFVSDKTVDTATVDRNTQQLKHASLAAERSDVSNRTAAAVINGYLKDIGELNQATAVVPKKLWRARNKERLETVREKRQ